MLKNLFRLINRKLWIKVLIPVSISVVLVMAGSLWFSIKAQDRFGRHQLNLKNKSLAMAVEGGMFDALAVGENDTVRAQFRRLNEKVKGLKVYVYDFNGVVSFSTDTGAVGKNMDAYVNAAILEDITGMISSGKDSEASFQTRTAGTDYIVKSSPILNERKCYHCHGSNRAVLGGISVLSSMTDMQQAIAKGRNTTILISLTGLILIIMLVWLFFYFIVNKKVGRVLASAARLREKDFTHEDSVPQGDEINHILNRINEVTRELRGVIRHIVDSSLHLAGSSNEMRQIADTLDSSSTGASERAMQVSAAAEEMSVNNKAMASAMEEAAGTMNALASAVDEMSATVGEISKNAADSKAVTDEMVAGFDAVMTAVTDLGNRAEDVDQVTNEIRSISEQVSLLALNAKIEAARAGEAGKGFAVVAQEITELASDSSRSTLEADEKLAAIKQMVQDMIAKVSAISGKINDSDQAISGIAASVEEQNVTTHEIAKSINDINQQISDMNHRVTQGAEAAADIARDITEVETASTRVKEESLSLNKGAGDLAKMAESFKRLMGQFKI
ncbi:MAG: methyl-accepting chemotaxis protein [Desulfobacter sp.]|nr:MAG: methyl-accepting chemotaxis protein [Desulfobacter sp.]